MGDELKRLAVISGLILVMALALLLPYAKWGMPQRPGHVPSTAAFANGGKGRTFWIDCLNLGADINRYSCTVYQASSGEMVVKGIFQQTSLTLQGRIFYDGSAIHWRHGQLLRPLQLQCLSPPQDANSARAGDPGPPQQANTARAGDSGGGRPPMVADCKTAGTRAN